MIPRASERGRTRSVPIDADDLDALLPELDGVADLPGCTISREQLLAWADGLAAHLGIRIG
jgi:hypothetical protein